MATIGGTVAVVTVRSRIMSVAGDADVNIDLGGLSNEVQPNGDGTVRVIQTRKPWMLEGIALVVNHDRADLQFLQQIADSGEEVPVTIELASGDVYQGKGTITGDVKLSTQNATAPITLSGGGKLTLQ